MDHPVNVLRTCCEKTWTSEDKNIQDTVPVSEARDRPKTRQGTVPSGLDSGCNTPGDEADQGQRKKSVFISWIKDKTM